MNDAPTQSVLSRIREVVLRDWPPGKWKSARTVVAVSGGPDSVAMLRVLQLLFVEHSHPDNLVVAHVNHKTRDGASDIDADFVAQLASHLNIECGVLDLDPTYAIESPSELSFRKARYQLLTGFAADVGARYIATGHNRDDQIETILFRIFRGTGINGLTGIPKIRQINEHVTLVRPLLGTSRAQVFELLKELVQNYCVDSTNSLSHYSRNFLRNEVIPKIKERFGETFENSLLRLGSQATENQALLDELCTTIYSDIETSEDKIVIRHENLIDQRTILVRHALVKTWENLNWPMQKMTSAHWSRLSEFVCHPEQQFAFHLPGNIRVERRDKTIVIVRR